MRSLIFAVFLLLVAVNVCDVSGKNDWLKNFWEGLKKVWKENKNRIIKGVFKAALTARDVNDVDMNNNNKLDASELSAHLDARDVDAILSNLDLDGDNAVSEEEAKRYINDLMENSE